MKAYKKRTGIAIVGLLLVTVILAGCSGGTSAPSPSAAESSAQNVYDNGLPREGKVTLKIAAPDMGFGKDMYEFAVAKFMEMYPNVEIELTASPQINEIVSSRVAANDDDEMFDLILGKYGFTTNMIAGGLVEDLSDLMNVPTWDDENITLGTDIMESTKTLFVYEGKLRLLPLDISLISIIYNKKMFEENGWNQDPKTWGEFLQLLDAIKASGKTDPIAFAGTVGYLPWLTNMASIYDDGWLERYVQREQGIYSDPATLAPIVKLKELKERGYFLAGTEALDHTQSQMEFLQGKAAMVPSGSWIENEMKNAAPPDFQYDIMIQPVNDNAVDTRYIQGYSNALWVYAKKTDLNKSWTKQFIRYYYSQEVQALFIKNGGVPVSKSIQSSESMKMLASQFNREVMELLSGNVELNLAYSMLPPDKLTANPKYTDADYKVFGPGYLEVYMGIKTPEQIGAEADAELEKAWAEVGGR